MTKKTVVECDHEWECFVYDPSAGNLGSGKICVKCGELMTMIAGVISMTTTSDSPTSKTDLSVLRICAAYESGFGHGLQGRALPQPYALGTGEHQAYQIGFDSGAKRRQSEAQPAASNQQLSRLARSNEYLGKDRDQLRDIILDRDEEIERLTRQLETQRTSLLNPGLLAHKGDPCIYCETPHDAVAPGACPGLIEWGGRAHRKTCGIFALMAIERNCNCDVVQPDETLAPLTFSYATCNSGGGEKPTVTLGFETLSEAQSMHGWLIHSQRSAVEPTPLRAGHIYSPREGTEVCFICGFHKSEHAPEHMPTEKAATLCTCVAGKLNWCAVHPARQVR